MRNRESEIGSPSSSTVVVMMEVEVEESSIRSLVRWGTNLVSHNYIPSAGNGSKPMTSAHVSSYPCA